MRKPPARERKPHRTFEKRRKPKLVRRAKPGPMFLVARPRVMQRGVPSLPAMPRQDDGRQHQYRSRLMMLSRTIADLAADANAFRQGTPCHYQQRRPFMAQICIVVLSTRSLEICPKTAVCPAGSGFGPGQTRVPG